MILVGMLSWWYTRGFALAARRVRDQLAGLYDYFSIDLLIKTLFSPFRQISAGAVDGPLPVKLRAFVDRLISRIIGAIVRLIIIAVGSAALLITVIGGLLYLVVWLAMPTAPLVGIILMLSGWIPWKL